MDNGFTVVVDEVRAHASTVAAIAGEVRGSGSAAQDSVSGGAYGAIGEFFASAITAACGDVRDVIGQASESVQQVETGLRGSADLYEHNDERHASLYAGRGESK